jgi:hypothetical protein
MVNSSLVSEYGGKLYESWVFLAGFNLIGRFRRRSTAHFLQRGNSFT